MYLLVHSLARAWFYMSQVTAQEPDTLLCFVAKNRKKEGMYYKVEFYRDAQDLAKHEAASTTGRWPSGVGRVSSGSFFFLWCICFWVLLL